MDSDALLQTIGRILRQVDDAAVRNLVLAVTEAPAIHIGGTGRAGLVASAFAASLAELGRRVHLVGSPHAPALRASELLLVVSGSGRTPALVAAAEHALQAQGRVACITAAVVAPLVRLAHLRIFLPPLLPESPTPERGSPPDEAALIHASRTLFEQAALLFLDGLVPLLMSATRQTAADLEARRSNLD